MFVFNFMKKISYKFYYSSIILFIIFYITFIFKKFLFLTNRDFFFYYKKIEHLGNFLAQKNYTEVLNFLPFGRNILGFSGWDGLNSILFSDIHFSPIIVIPAFVSIIGGEYGLYFFYSFIGAVTFTYFFNVILEIDDLKKYFVFFFITLVFVLDFATNTFRPYLLMIYLSIFYIYSIYKNFNIKIILILCLLLLLSREEALIITIFSSIHLLLNNKKKLSLNIFFINIFFLIIYYLYFFNEGFIYKISKTGILFSLAIFIYPVVYFFKKKFKDISIPQLKIIYIYLLYYFPFIIPYILINLDGLNYLDQLFWQHYYFPILFILLILISFFLVAKFNYIKTLIFLSFLFFLASFETRYNLISNYEKFYLYKELHKISKKINPQTNLILSEKYINAFYNFDNVSSLSRFKPITQSNPAEIKVNDKNEQRLVEVILKQEILIINKKEFSDAEILSNFVYKFRTGSNCENNEYFLFCKIN